ncbi:hypothetical protein SBA1_1470011 [Candidatus Sulfotelmatobacter kueseliae]|uniref:Uncharacterized protein n=1 Tax=Candidatus Sulfotelmatobacter kueseliae TaxID=2042962 RepID=A0A2U3K8L1_9BACT|nr:hypothetical protein SBA1_1470011 [Candidatus Sulfotelmatobacter kueseliae]
MEAGYAGMPCRLCEESGLLMLEDDITKLRAVDPYGAKRNKPRPKGGLCGSVVRRSDWPTYLLLMGRACRRTM